MSQLLILLIISHTLLVSGLIRLSNDVTFFDNDLDEGWKGSPRVRYVESASKTPLWVLRLGFEEFDSLRLKVASGLEEDDFNAVFEPLIERLEQQQDSVPRRIRKKQKPDENNNLKNEKLKMDIMKIVNKFALSTNIEPDIYLSESDDGSTSTLALYFKGPYTSLIVKLGNKQWHYFIRTSPFPEWFYEVHEELLTNDGNEKYIDVPDSVLNEFYKVLLHTIQMFLGFPV